MAFDADGYPIETKTPVATQQVAQQVDSDGYPTQATQEKEVAQQVNADGYPIQPTSDSPSALDYAGGLGIEISGSLASNVVASAYLLKTMRGRVRYLGEELLLMLVLPHCPGVVVLKLQR